MTGHNLFLWRNMKNDHRIIIKIPSDMDLRTIIRAFSDVEKPVLFSDLAALHC